MSSLVHQNWLFDVGQRASRNPFDGRAKKFLHETLYECLTSHNLQGCYDLIHVLAKDTTIDPYILLRYIFILIESNQAKDVNKNVIIYLETLLGSLELNKPDVFAEFTAYFVRNNRIHDAKELYSQRYIRMTYLRHRPLPFADVNLKCYDFLLNYLSWSKQVGLSDIQHQFDVSIQGWLVNIMKQLMDVTSNYEFFVICIIRVLLFYGYTKKAYLFMSQFQRNNHDNFSAQLLLLRLLDELTDEATEGKKYELCVVTPMDQDGQSEREKNRNEDMNSLNNFSLDLADETFDINRYPIHEDRETILCNLRRLDSSREEINELTTTSRDLQTIFMDQMNAFEHLSEINNFRRWKVLKSTLHDIMHSKNPDLVAEVKEVWMSQYKRYWSTIDFLEMLDFSAREEDRKLVKRVVESLHKKLDHQ